MPSRGSRPPSRFAKTEPPGATPSNTSPTPTAAAIEKQLDKQVAKSGETALAGRDGAKAEQLLDRAKREGTAVLADVCRSAVKRMLAGGVTGALQTKQLFSADERQAVIDALAATNATSNLLGRSRIRLRKEQAEKAAGQTNFTEVPTSFEVFDETTIKPFAPEEAVDYFKNLVPTLGVDPQVFGPLMRRQAFTLAINTDLVVLDQVKSSILRVLETGEKLDDSWRSVNKLLEEAGVSSRNPQYSEQIFRTNLKSAYNEGADQERQDPDVAEAFPVWKYVGIEDGRQRPEHAQHFGKFFANDVPFSAVRDSVKTSPWNCRCDQIPVYVSDWAKLQAAGATLSSV